VKQPQVFCCKLIQQKYPILRNSGPIHYTFRSIVQCELFFSLLLRLTKKVSAQNLDMFWSLWSKAYIFAFGISHMWYLLLGFQEHVKSAFGPYCRQCFLYIAGNNMDSMLILFLPYVPWLPWTQPCICPMTAVRRQLWCNKASQTRWPCQ